MPDHDPAFWAAAIAAVLISGVSKGGFGAGLGFAATPLLALAAGPSAAAGIMLPLLILMDQAGMAAWRGRWSWPAARAMLTPAAVGIGAGALAFGSVSTDGLRFGLGLVAVGFLAFQLARLRGWAPPARGGRGLRAAVWGSAAGFTSTISHAGGPPVTIYLLGEKLGKAEWQATSVLIFWAINLMKVGPYAVLGALDLSTLGTSLVLAPVAAFGVWVGMRLHRLVPERLFLGAMTVLLGLTGAKLLWDGARGLFG